MHIPIWFLVALTLISASLIWALISLSRVHLGLVTQLAENQKLTDAAVRSEKSMRRILEALQKRGITIPEGYTLPFNKPVDVDALVKAVYDISKQNGLVGHGNNPFYMFVDLHGQQQYRSEALEDGRIIVYIDTETHKKAPKHIIAFAKEVEARMKQEAEYQGVSQ